MEVVNNLYLICKSKITKIIQSFNSIPEHYKVIYIITLGIILILLDCITINRLIYFVIILFLIAIYKILHKTVYYICNIFNIEFTNQNIVRLLKIYKYKNPIILLIIGIEEKLFNYIYSLTKANVKPKHINIIYNILYNLTGYNGVKIILYKFYEILKHGKYYSIYEIIFKRIYGMILSVLIFTNVLQIILLILNAITTNYILGIYIFLILISYISNLRGFMGWPKDVISLESSRIECNLLGIMLKGYDYSCYSWHNINKNTKIRLNKDIKIHLGFLDNNRNLLNYENLLKYRTLKMGSSFNNNGMEYANKPSFFFFNEIIVINTFYGIENYVITKYHKLQKIEKSSIEQQLLIYCEYKILIYKLILFYIGDVESGIGISETNYKLVKEKDLHPLYDEDLITLSYTYTDKNLNKIYQTYLNNSIKDDKFGDLQENYNFYEKMHTYLNDIDFQESEEYKKIEKIYFEDESQETGLAGPESEEYRGIDLKIREGYLEKQLKLGRDEGYKYKDQELQKKYLDIMQEIDNIKKNV